MAKSVENRLGYRGVDVDQREGFTLFTVARQMDAAAVQRRVPEQGSNPADNAGHIPIVDGDQVTEGDRFDIELVQSDDPRMTPAENGALHRELGLSLQSKGQAGGEILVLASPLL